MEQYMRMSAAVAFTFSLTFAGGCYAGEAEKPNKTEPPNKIEALTSTQLGDYTFRLETDRPEPGNAPMPSGLVPAKPDQLDPFVGFKLSRPLGTSK